MLLYMLLTAAFLIAARVPSQSIASMWHCSQITSSKFSLRQLGQQQKFSATVIMRQQQAVAVSQLPSLCPCRLLHHCALACCLLLSAVV
jgi:hypothetical protein